LSFIGIGLILKSLRRRVRGDIKYIGNTFIDDGINQDTIKEINSGLVAGEALILENLRFLQGETAPLTSEEHAKTKFVRDLVDTCKIDYFVLDAFSVSHRSHRSVVGFAEEVPCIAGPSLHEELSRIDKIVSYFHGSGEPNSIYILGGIKIQDYFSLLESALESAHVSKILTGGLLGNLCLFARHYDIGMETQARLRRPDLKGRTAWDYLPRISKLLEKYPDIVEVPIDLSGSANGSPTTYRVDSVPEGFCAYDIGTRTIRRYKEIIQDVVCRSGGRKTLVYIKGPVGAYDLEDTYARGSLELLVTLTGDLREQIYTVMGGGDTTAMLKAFEIDSKLINYISLAGGALIRVLGGEKLPGVKMLEESYLRFGNESGVYV